MTEKINEIVWNNLSKREKRNCIKLDDGGIFIFKDDVIDKMINNEISLISILKNGGFNNIHNLQKILEICKNKYLLTKEEIEEIKNNGRRLFGRTN